MGTLEPARLHPLAIQYGGQLHSAPEPQLEYMQMNVRLPAFDDARVRRALNYAVDRGEVAELARRRVSVPHGIGGRRPKRLSLEMQLHADWAITLACGARCPYVSSTVEDWDVADPAGEPIEEVRKIRDDIEQRVLDLVENKMDLIRQDRRQHQLRMSHLVPGLVKEFGDRLTGEEIRSIADDILDTYDDVPVRSFVMTLANRRAREILKARAGETVGTA